MTDARKSYRKLIFPKLIVIIFVVFLIGFQTNVITGSIQILGSSNYLLVTGFEPFYIYDVNPSQLIVEAINGTVINNITVIGSILPVNFSESVTQITSEIDRYNPVLVLSLGLNGEARMVQVENLGINIRKRPRSDPFWFIPKRLDPEGPFLLRTLLPTIDMVSAIRSQGIPARNSMHAGTYVCNAVFYHTLRYIEHNKQIPMGFIHVPPLDYQAPYGMNFSVLLDAIDISLKTCLES